MLKKLITSVRGVLTTIWYTLNTLFWVLPFIPIAVVKFIIPLNVVSRLLDRVASFWVKSNNVCGTFLTRTHINVIGHFSFSKEKRYMLIANHQSWVDILVLHRVFHNQIPFLKFFIKKELVWMPVLGFIWWALDFPLMRRYSPSFLKKYPHLKGKDLDITRRACEKFKELPVTVASFVEGTRFSIQKKCQQASPFKHLLRPKAGGMAFTLSAMGQHLHQLVDVTICYPKGAPSFWDFVCGRVREVYVKINTLPIDDKIIGDYMNNARFKDEFQQWLNALWLDKDRALTQLYALDKK